MYNLKQALLTAQPLAPLKFTSFNASDSSELFDFYTSFNTEGIEKEFLFLPASPMEIKEKITQNAAVYFGVRDTNTNQIIAAQKIGGLSSPLSPFFFANPAALDFKKVLTVSTMYVAPDRRGQGLAGTLLGAAQAAALKSGCEALAFDCDVRNESAMRAYARIAQPYGIGDGTKNGSKTEATGYFIWLYYFGQLALKATKATDLTLSKNTADIPRNITAARRMLENAGELDETLTPYESGTNTLYTLKRPIKVNGFRIRYPIPQNQRL